MKKLLTVTALAALVLTGCAAQAPQAQPLMGSAGTATAEPTASAETSATPVPTGAHVDEDAFYSAVSKHWMHGNPPDREEALEAGYEMCGLLDSGAAEIGDHILTDYSKQDDALIQWNVRAWLCPTT